MPAAARRACSSAECTRIRRSSARRSSPADGCSASHRPAARRWPRAVPRSRRRRHQPRAARLCGAAHRRRADGARNRRTRDARGARAVAARRLERGRRCALSSTSTNPKRSVDFWKAHLDTRRFRAGLDALMSVTALRAVYAPRLLASLPDALRRGDARTDGALLRHPSQPDESLGACAARRANSRANLPHSRRKHQARAVRRGLVSRERATGELRRIRAFQHPRWRGRRLPATALPRRFPRRRARRDGRARGASANPATRCPQTGPPTIVPCCGASST